jgi:predicted acyltransferase
MNKAAPGLVTRRAGVWTVEIPCANPIRPDITEPFKIMGTLPADQESSAASGRLLSIDALRGFDMFWIIGGEEIAVTLARWADWPFKEEVERQLQHAPWEGFRFYDLIFPLFLFVVGAVLPFSLGSHRLKGESTFRIYGRILRRTVLLFFLGLLYNGLLKFDFENLRIAGVLQRIAICYGVAALIVLHVGWRGQVVTVATLLLGYWALLAFVPAPGSAPGDYTKERNLPGYVDRTYLPGKIYEEYYGYGDNEGLLSTMPAVATALLGALAGQWLRAGTSAGRKVVGLLVAGVACLPVGYGWGLVFPIIKNLWTSSFVLYAAGWSLLLLALFYGIIDALGYRRWAFFFVVIGSNAIVIYILPHFLDFRFIADALFGGLIKHTGSFAPVAVHLSVLAVEWLLLFYLFRKRLFLRV